MSLGSRTVTCGGKPVDLTSVEFNVLELLLRHAGKVVTREQIAEAALGRSLNFLDRSVDVHVSRVRRKLGACIGSGRIDQPNSRHRLLSRCRDGGEEQGMNRRLFWKIFLPFWAAQAVLLGALYLRLHYRISSEHPWWIQPERREMPVLANLAAQTFEQQGQAGLAPLLDKLSLPNRSRFWLVDANGRELSGREDSATRS